MQDDKQSIWKQTLDTIKLSVSPAIFSTWFAGTHLIEIKKNGKRAKAEIGCPSSFARDTIENRYFGLLQETLSKTLETKCDLEFVVKDLPVKKTTSPQDNVSPLFSQDTSTANDKIRSASLASARIRPDQTFDNFAVSASNQMAWAAADAVSKNPGTAYNPLFIWGGVGVGKTHLMMAIGNEILKINPSSSMLYCSAEEFTNDIVQGIKNKTTENFRNRYRKRKILFIDDIQFIAGKNSIQEEFFHTFNAITGSGGQIVLTSDQPPSDIARLEERLRSRFEAGLIVDIGQPDFELRTAITLIKAREKGINLDMEQAQLIAGNVDSARRIEGVLTKIISQTSLRKQEINLELIQNIIGKGVTEEAQKIKATPAEIITAASKYFSIGKRELLGPKRSRPIARPRQILMYFLRVEMNLPLEEVGRLVGGRDHTTVMHAVDKITKLLSTNEDIREDIMGIKKTI